MCAEGEFYAGLSGDRCKDFAAQFRDALVTAAPNSAALAEISMETDPVTLRDAWVGTIKEHTSNYAGLFATAQPTAPKTPKPSFLDSVRSAIAEKRTRSNDSPAMPPTSSPPTSFLDSVRGAVQSRNTINLTGQPSFTTPPVTPTKFNTPAAPMASPTPAVAIPAVAAVTPATAATSAKPYTPFVFDTTGAAHVELLRKSNGDPAKGGLNTIDWVASAFGAEPADIHALLKGTSAMSIACLNNHLRTRVGTRGISRSWAKGELKGICNQIVSLFDLTETRKAVSVSLSKEAADRMLSRESQLHRNIRICLQVVQLGEGRARGYMSQVMVAGSKDDFTSQFGDKSFESFMRELKKAKHEQAQPVKRQGAERRDNRPRPARRPTPKRDGRDDDRSPSGYRSRSRPEYDRTRRTESRRGKPDRRTRDRR
jgi:hypothetical protein